MSIHEYRGVNEGNIRWSRRQGLDPQERMRVCVLSGFNYPESQMVKVEGRWVSMEHLDDPNPRTGKVFEK